MPKLVISLSHILEYVGVRKRPIVEGEAVFRAGHVIRCQLENAQLAKVFALVLRTSAISSPPHEVKLMLNYGPRNWQCQCSCKAGQSRFCKHVMATLIYINRYEELEELSCTDIVQSWRKGKKGVQLAYEATKIRDFCHPKKKSLEEKHQSCCRAVSTLYQQSFSASTKSASYKFAKMAKLQERILPTTTSSVPGNCVANQSPDINNLIPRDIYKAIIKNIKISTFLETLDLKPYYPVRNCCKDVLNELESVDFEKAAIQSHQGSAEWMELRKLRVTGSRCYSIYTYKKPDWENKAVKYFWEKEFTNSSLEHGKTFEKNAVEAYKQRNPSVALYQPGIIISEKFPWIGYSPDGVIFENGFPVRLLEVKCPIAGKRLDAAGLETSCTYLQKNENGDLELKRKHAYYGQVQLGMSIMNLQRTNFVVYSSFADDILDIVVHFDPTFANLLLNKVTQNYFNFMLHVYCENKENFMN